MDIIKEYLLIWTKITHLKNKRWKLSWLFFAFTFLRRPSRLTLLCLRPQMDPDSTCLTFHQKFRMRKRLLIAKSSIQISSRFKRKSKHRGAKFNKTNRDWFFQYRCKDALCNVNINFCKPTRASCERQTGIYVITVPGLSICWALPAEWNNLTAKETTYNGSIFVAEIFKRICNWLGWWEPL